MAKEKDSKIFRYLDGKGLSRCSKAQYRSKKSFRKNIVDFENMVMRFQWYPGEVGYSLGFPREFDHLAIAYESKTEPGV